MSLPNNTATAEEDSTRVSHSSSTSSVVLETQVPSQIKFFHALSTVTSRPELLIPHVRSTDIDWSSLDQPLKKCHNNHVCSNLFDFVYSPVYHQGKCISSRHAGELCGSLHEDTIKEMILPNSDTSNNSLTLVRYIYHKPMNKDNKLGWTSRVKERWDFGNQSVEVTPINDERLPFAPFITFTAKYIEDKKIAILKLSSYSGELETPSDESFEYYKNSVVPKIFEWMSDAYIVEAPKLSRLRARPLSLIQNSTYWAFYDLIKAGPAEQVKSIWKETTDPVKFIHEDVGIAAYIASFIYGKDSMYRDQENTDSIDILDLGCGNGLLCFFLSQILSAFSSEANVVGFDIRKRRIWADLLQKGQELNNQLTQLLKDCDPTSIPGEKIQTGKNNVRFELKERTFVPHILDDIIELYGRSKEDRIKKSLWLIGNHSDELTPWIPVVSRLLNANGFFIIPCCPYDFFKKYQRVGNLPGSSIYHNYIEYICTVGDKFGYCPILEKLRIPSTKSISLVGIDCSRKFEEGVLSQRVHELMTQLKNTKEEESSSLYKFIPRSKESAKENPKLDRNVATGIVDKIFQLLVKDIDDQRAEWCSGASNVTFSDITSSILTVEEREMLKGKGRGLRTLVKSNKHLFVINCNVVQLRTPNEKDIENVSESSRDRIKTRDCYFKLNHPQGCPLPSNLCSYRH